MNRQRILACIEHHLREDLAAAGGPRPLVQIVADVAADLGNGKPLASVAPVRPDNRPISVEKIAAFVDGQLADHHVAEVARAILSDPSVLAEVIAAVKSQITPLDSLPALSDTLTERLLCLPAELAANPKSTEAASSSHPAVDRASVPRSIESDRARHQIADASSPHVDDPQSNSPIKLDLSRPINGKSASHPTRRQKVRPQRLLVATAVAASALVAVAWLAFRGEQSPNPPDVAVDPSGINRVPSSYKDDFDDTRGREAAGAPVPATLAERDRNRPSGFLPGELPREGLSTDGGDAIGSGPSRVETIATAEPYPESPVDSPEVDPTFGPTEPSSPSLRPLAVPSLNWKSVSGLLVRRNLPATSATGTSDRRPGWRGVAITSLSGTSSQARQDAIEGGSVALKTLPFSRGEADWEGVGRMVLAADSSVQLQRSSAEAVADVDLQYGSVALLDVADGTLVQLVHNDRVLAKLRWSDSAELVLQRIAGGFQLLIHRGTIDVNGQPHRGQAIVVKADQPPAQTEAPKRLPAWVDRPVDGVAIPRTVLAQFADSDDVARTLQQQIQSLASSARLSVDEQRTLAQLTHWQAALSDTALLRMLNSTTPAVRLAAMQRLVQMPPSDPRYGPTWRAIDRVAANKQRVAQLRRWSEMARRGIRPNRNQLEQMVAGLSAQDVAGRAMADYLLRQFHANGPPFDPAWNAATRQRAINVWRQRLGLPASRATQPNAAN